MKIFENVTFSKIFIFGDPSPPEEFLRCYHGGQVHELTSVKPKNHFTKPDSSHDMLLVTGQDEFVHSETPVIETGSIQMKDPTQGMAMKVNLNKNVIPQWENDHLCCQCGTIKRAEVTS